MTKTRKALWGFTHSRVVPRETGKKWRDRTTRESGEERGGVYTALVGGPGGFQRPPAAGSELCLSESR